MNNELNNKYLDDIDKLGFEKSLMLNTKDVSKILRVTLRTLENWRKDDMGPVCKKIGKAYFYTKRDVAEFLAKN